MPIKTKPRVEKEITIYTTVPEHVKTRLDHTADCERRTVANLVSKIVCDWAAGEEQTAAIDNPDR